LHFGQRSATAAVTGRVKCFTCPHAVHFQPRDRNSGSLGRSANARSASPLIFSRRYRRWLVVWAIDLAPTGAAGGDVCVFGDRRIGAIAFSCSSEHRQQKAVVQSKIQPEIGHLFGCAHRICSGAASDFELAVHDKAGQSDFRLVSSDSRRSRSRAESQRPVEVVMTH